jgi:hypothetical protein
VGGLDQLRDQLVRTKWLYALSALWLALGACERTQAEAPPPGAGVIDSIFPVDEEIRRFRAAHRLSAVDSLAGGAASRGELVQRFMAAVILRDTVAARALKLDAGEFIDLYFPHSPYARAPYRQNPAFVWFQLEQNSNTGLTRVFNRYGGQPSGYRGYRCAGQPVRQGESRLWRDCVVEWRLLPHSVRLFGSIFEHAGRYKFVSFGNDL